MSVTANWSYTNEAQVKPFIRMDTWTGVIEYGEPYVIKCTWEISAEQFRDNNGAEFVSRHKIYTEDLRPKKLDQIRLKASTDSEDWTEWEEIRDRTEWDMSFFGEVPDVRLVT